MAAAPARRGVAGRAWSALPPHSQSTPSGPSEDVAPIADGATDLDAARLLVHRAAGDLPAASMALSFATSAARRATDDAIQLHGGYGYTREYPVERFWRDAKYCQIALGGQRAHRLDVARRVIDRLG